MKQVEDDPELYQEAVNAWFAYCEAKGIIPDNPSRDVSEIGREYVHLRNSYRSLGRYSIKDKAIVAE